MLVQVVSVLGFELNPVKIRSIVETSTSKTKKELW